MSSIINKFDSNCVSCSVLLNDKKLVKNRNKCNKCPNNIRNKSKKTITKHLYEDNSIQNS